MGQEKSLLPLAGKPLIAHAVAKLQKLCAKVSILSSNPALAQFGPLLPDLHPHCGPMSGIEAALLNAEQDWSLIHPVDVPFPPATFLANWVANALATPARLALFIVDGRPQPTLLLIHRTLAPFLTEALKIGRYRLYPELVVAAHALGPDTLHLTPIEAREASALYFTNLNTPDDFKAAEQQSHLLEP